MFAVPYGSFIIIQLRTLCVPVSGNKQQFIRFKVVFLQLGLVGISLVLGITSVIGFQTVIVVAVFKRIYNCFPLPVEGCRLACADI